MRIDRHFLAVGFAISLVSGSERFCTGQVLSTARAQEAAPEALAAQLRRQGHQCDGPVSAQRDAERSKPDAAVWVIKCANATYRMRLMPHMAAQVEQI